MTLRIGHYVPKPEAPGGMSAYVRQVINEQQRLGHTVRLLSAEDTKDTAWNNESLDVIHLHEGLNLSSVSRPLVRTVHDHKPYCPSGTLYLAARNTPCDRTSHLGRCSWGKVVDRCGSVRPAKVRADFHRLRDERRELREIPVIVISEFMEEKMVADGYDPYNLFLLRPPTPAVPRIWTPPGDDIVFVGRVARAKGIRSLIDAFALVPQATLKVVGEGPDLAWAKARVADLGLKHRVTFPGWLAPADVAAHVRAARAVVVPSAWHEPAGMVVFEAMAAGRPVVATRSGGITEVVGDSGGGILTEVGQPLALAAALQRLLDDKELAAEMGLCGRRYAQRQQTVADHCAILLAIYERARSQWKDLYEN